MQKNSEIDWKEFGVFTSQSMFNEVLVVYVLATLFFFVAYFLNKMYFPGIMMALNGDKSPYFALDEKNRREYHSRNVADIHGLISGPLAVYSTFFVCDESSENIFSNYECIMKPQRSQIWLIAISSAYVTYDLWLCIYELGYTMKKGGDFIMHHLVGLLGALTVLVSGRFNVALSCGQLISEFTGFPMNWRWRMLKHKMTEGFGFMLVNAIFFFGYFFCRIVFMAMLLLRNVQVQYRFSIFSDPPVVYGCAILSTVFQIGLYLIQLFWFKAIFGAFLRTIQGGAPKIGKRDD